MERDYLVFAMSGLGQYGVMEGRWVLVGFCDD